MAKITILLLDGSSYECDGIDLSACSNQDIIRQMISSGYLIPEEELPIRNEQGDHIVYTLINESGSVIEFFENKSLAEIGFVDGDTIRIIPITGKKYYNQRATLTIKLLSCETCNLGRVDLESFVPSGEEYEFKNLDLEHMSPELLIREMIFYGALRPTKFDGLHLEYEYSIIDKNNTVIKSDSDQTFSQLGFTDGDTMRIFCPCKKSNIIWQNSIEYNMSKLRVIITFSGEAYDIDGVSLEHNTPKQLIEKLITNGALQPEDTLPATADSCCHVYGIVDKNNVKIQPDSYQTFSQLGFIDGDTVRIIMLASGA